MATETETKQPPEPEAPGGLAWVPWIGHQITREWPVIKSAPVTFFFVAALSATLGVVGATLFYSERISTYEARDRYISGQLADYKSAFPGKSSDEAVMEVGELRIALGDAQKHLQALENAASLARDESRKEIAEIRQQLEETSKRQAERHLTEEQKGGIASYVCSDADKFQPVTVLAVEPAEAMNYGKEIITEFKSCGISVNHAFSKFGETIPDLSGTADLSRRGLYIPVVDKTKPDAQSAAFRASLMRAKIYANFVEWEDELPAGMPAPHTTLFVSNR